MITRTEMIKGKEFDLKKLNDLEKSVENLTN